jgi:glycosyltransferase involved in cell wall biosynthesis
MSSSIAVIILTYNEELNIRNCVENAKKLTEKIYIIDSFSTDKTLDICRELGCEIHQHPFENQAKQLNWALENVEIGEEWILRLDADEYMTDELIEEIKQKLPTLNDTVNGIFLKRRLYFLGKWMKRGIYPIYVMRLWRNKKAICEDRWMDEHMKLLSGESISFEYDFIDYDNKNLTLWIQKHNNYASREAIEYLSSKYNLTNSNIVESRFWGTQEQRKKWIKKNLYSRLPVGVRPSLYFIYRYFLRMGFLDGFRGFVFHSMQGFWYRLLVDAKVYEIEKKMQESGKSFKQTIEEEFGYKL